jgi:hypothetical protein
MSWDRRSTMRTVERKLSHGLQQAPFHTPYGQFREAVGIIWAPAAPVKLRVKHGEWSSIPLSSVFSLLLVFFSNVAPSDAWRARSAKAKQARRRVGETGDGVVVEEAEEAGSGACS